MVQPRPVQPKPIQPNPGDKGHDRPDRDRHHKNDHDRQNQNNPGQDNSGGAPGGDAGGSPGGAPESPPAPQTQQADNPPTLQIERYLQVNNQTGQPLWVHIQPPGPGQTLTWEFQAGQVAYLAVNDVYLSGSQVKIWADSKHDHWTKHKYEVLFLVSLPYRADSIGTLAYTFNPNGQVEVREN